MPDFTNSKANIAELDMEAVTKKWHKIRSEFEELRVGYKNYNFIQVGSLAMQSMITLFDNRRFDNTIR